MQERSTANQTASVYSAAKRLVTIVLGVTLLVLGAAMLVLPGPGVVMIMLGLAVLGAEFLWARRLLDRMKAAGRNAIDGVTRPGGDRPRKKSGGWPWRSRER